MVRVADAGRATITRALDAGAEGVIVAMIQSLDDVRLCVQSSKYPPLGGRGVHMLRPHTDFAPPKDIGAYMHQSNCEIILGAQIETTAAVGLIDQIAATPGIDLLYLGPVDLSVALGIPGATGHDKIVSVAMHMARACRDHGKLAGIHAADTDTLARLVPEGMRLFGHAADLRLFWNGAQAFMAAAKRDVMQIQAKPNEART
jgi:4-hydroxy-2-oxoheptanedioate aldolase